MGLFLASGIAAAVRHEQHYNNLQRGPSVVQSDDPSNNSGTGSTSGSTGTQQFKYTGRDAVDAAVQDWDTLQQFANQQGGFNFTGALREARASDALSKAILNPDRDLNFDSDEAQRVAEKLYRTADHARKAGVVRAVLATTMARRGAIQQLAEDGTPPEQIALSESQLAGLLHSANPKANPTDVQIIAQEAWEFGQEPQIGGRSLGGVDPLTVMAMGAGVLSDKQDFPGASSSAQSRLAGASLAEYLALLASGKVP